MGALLLELLPLIVAAALLPVWIIMALFLLRSEGGVAKALAFAGGATSVRLIQGLLFGFVFGAGAEQETEGSALIASTLLLVIGLLMLIAAYKKWRKEEDPDEPPKWMDKLSGLTAVKAFGMGALLMTVAVKQWVFTLSAIAIIEELHAEMWTGVAAFLIFVLAAQLLILLPILVYAIMPTQAARWLDAAQGWLARHNRIITVAVSLVFGVWFVWKGVTGLLG
jgi:hypothetical protein